MLLLSSGILIQKRLILQSPSIITLAPEAAFLLHNSLAPSTRRRNGTILRTHESFCQQFQHTSYPPFLEAVSYWLAQILSSVKPATAKSYLSALKSSHVETRMPITALKDPCLDLIIREKMDLWRKVAVQYDIPSLPRSSPHSQ